MRQIRLQHDQHPGEREWRGNPHRRRRALAQQPGGDDRGQHRAGELDRRRVRQRHPLDAGEKADRGERRSDAPPQLHRGPRNDEARAAVGDRHRDREAECPEQITQRRDGRTGPGPRHRFDDAVADRQAGETGQRHRQRAGPVAIFPLFCRRSSHCRAMAPVRQLSKLCPLSTIQAPLSGQDRWRQA